MYKNIRLLSCVILDIYDQIPNNGEHNGKVAHYGGFFQMILRIFSEDHKNVNMNSYCLIEDMTMNVTYFTLCPRM